MTCSARCPLSWQQGWLCVYLDVSWLLLLLLVSVCSGDTYPRPCTDLKPLYFLQHIAPERYELPAGVEIVYDEEYSTHAYHFTSRAATLSFPAAAILKYCAYFPEEYSLLVTLKVSKQTANRDETLFAVIPVGSTKVKMGLRLYRSKLYLDYSDPLRRRRKTAVFNQLRIFDQKWHTFVMSITADRISLRTDCGKKRTKRLVRTFPSMLSMEEDHIHIGNRKRGRKGYYTGLLKQLILLPGSDISRIMCPAEDPTLPEISNSWPTIDDLSAHAHNPIDQDLVCTWRDSGKMWFDIYKKTLKVCYSGIWQPVLLPPEQKVDQRMDYITWYQDIVTAAPTIDIEVFSIPDEGLFMATASFDSRDLKKQQSAIFKWENDRFQLYQSLYTLGAQSWEHFQIGKHFFLAVANHGEKRVKPSKSVVYRWNRRRKLFRVYEEIVTWTARDLEHFEINGDHFMVVANHVQGHNHSIASVLYQWNEVQQGFRPIQNITTVGAYDWTHFTVDGYDFLAVANSFTGAPTFNTQLESVVYFWQEGQFLPFQNLQTTGATDWEYFRIGNEVFLAVVNAFSFGPNTDNTSSSYQTNSTIYRLSVVRKQFEVYQQIITHSAIDWEFFEVGEDHFLVVSNAQHDGSEEFAGRPLATTRSVIYRWQGVEKFVPVHYLNTLPSADWESFTVAGEIYLVYANANDNVSQVYKIKMI